MSRTPKGGTVNRPPKVPDVRTLPCPSRADLDAGPHELQTNTEGTRNALTRCVWCRRVWGDLDAEARKG